MSSRQAFWRKLAGLAVLALGALQAHAQTPPPTQTGTRPSVDPNITRTSASIERPAAVVNGESIPMIEVKKLIDARPYPVTLSEDQKKSLRQAAVEMLIDDVLMRQYLSKQVPQLDQAEFSKETQQLQEGLRKEKKTMAQFLKEAGISEDRLRCDMVARVQWRTFLLQQCPEASLKKYYDDNKPFFDRVIVKASHILIKVPKTATPEQKQQAQQRLLAIRNEIVTGKIEFAAAAKKYSDCPSKDNKEPSKPGDIGPFPYKFVVVEPIARATFALKKGEVTEIVATEFGFHILRVDDRTAGEPSSFEAMRDAVREVWAQDTDLHQRILAEQRRTGKIEINVQ